MERAVNTDCPFTFPEEVEESFTKQFKPLAPEYATTNINISHNEDFNIYVANTKLKTTAKTYARLFNTSYCEYRV